MAYPARPIHSSNPHTALGAKVIATAGSEAKLEIAKKQGGADYGIDYTKEGWQKKVLEITGGHGADVIYDPVGMIQPSLKCIAWNGRALVVGFAAGSIEKVGQACAGASDCESQQRQRKEDGKCAEPGDISDVRLVLPVPLVSLLPSLPPFFCRQIPMNLVLLKNISLVSALVPVTSGPASYSPTSCAIIALIATSLLDILLAGRSALGKRSCIA